MFHLISWHVPQGRKVICICTIINTKFDKDLYRLVWNKSDKHYLMLYLTSDHDLQRIRIRAQVKGNLMVNLDFYICPSKHMLWPIWKAASLRQPS